MEPTEPMVEIVTREKARLVEMAKYRRVVLAASLRRMAEALVLDADGCEAGRRVGYWGPSSLTSRAAELDALCAELFHLDEQVDLITSLLNERFF